MIENLLLEKLSKIFGLKKASFDQPGESIEQDCLFIDLESSHTNVKDGRISGRVQGIARVYARRDKMPIGYFAKCIAKADPNLTKEFFFNGIDESTKVYQNLVERSFNFIFFFNSQYDPAIGNITSIETQRSE